MKQDEEDKGQVLTEEQIEEILEVRGIVWHNLYRPSDDLPFPGSPPSSNKPKKKRWTIFRDEKKKRIV